MQDEPSSTNIELKNIYYLGRDLSNKTKLRETLNFRPYVEKLGFNILIEDDLFSELNPFMKISGIKDITLFLPKYCSLELERFLLALGISYFILHSQAGKRPCVINQYSSGKIGLEAYCFAIGITSKLDEINKANKSGLTLEEMSKLFVLPNFAIDIAVNGLLAEEKLDFNLDTI